MYALVYTLYVFVVFKYRNLVTSFKNIFQNHKFHIGINSDSGILQLLDLWSLSII
jgi:hypothetical protein